MPQLAARPKRLIPHLRWWIIGVCFLSTMLNYIDRQCLSLAADTLKKEFDWSASDYGSVIMSFRGAYMIMQFVSGAIVDKIGVRFGMALFAAWWCVAAMLHAFGRGLWSFRAARFLLGMGEAGNWPSATKAVSEWFPPRERSMAVAIFDSGSIVGGLVAAPLVMWLIVQFNWRVAFLVTGAMVIPWLVLWLWIYRRPEEHERITPAELDRVMAERPKELEENQPSEPWYWVLGSRRAWGIVLGRLLSDCVWFFYVDWMALYLFSVRGFGPVQVATLVGIPLIAADFGNFAGGGLSSYLLRRGWTLNAARKAVLILGAGGMLASIPAGLIPFPERDQSVSTATSEVSNTSAAAEADTASEQPEAETAKRPLSANDFLFIALAAIVTFSYSAWGTIMLTLPADLFPSRYTGSVSGLSGTGAGLGGVLSAWLIGVAVDRFSYTPVFVAAGILPLIALLAIQLCIPRMSAFDDTPATV